MVDVDRPKLLVSNPSEFSSPAERLGKVKKPLKLALVQDLWHGDVATQIDSFFELVDLLNDLNPDLVVFQELTLSSYSCYKIPEENQELQAEHLLTGKTMKFAQDVAKRVNSTVVASLFEQSLNSKGYNTAITVGPDGSLLSKTRKKHLPVTSGYFENKYFDEGDDDFKISKIKNVSIATPTCWDQWFPELARIYRLRGAELIVYPTAIGSEPDYPNFQTKDIWQTMMVAHGIANGLFIAAANRIGTEGPLAFYGSSFISDPYGRVLVQADESSRSVLFAEIDLSQGEDWLELFPLLATRRPSLYLDLIKEN